MNYYNSFQDASDSNWQLLVDLFGKSKTLKLIKPNAINSVYDGILSCTKDNKDICILIEVKRRNFDIVTLSKEYNNTLFLEKDKYTYLHKRAAELSKVPGREIKIWYLSKTRDGEVFIHDITNKDYCWVSTKMNNVTYSDNTKKVDKKVALLNTSDSIFAFKTNILN